jgi:glycine betaine/proline transport system substrate-binding protein
MGRHFRRGFALLLGAVLCGPLAAQTGDPLNCRTVRFGLFGYSDIAATTALTSEILHDIGYQPEAIDLSIPVIFASLAKGDIDVFLGNWMPAQQAERNPYLSKGAIEVVGANLEHAKFTLAVPHYLYQAGLTDFAAISHFSDALYASIYGIEPGSAANRLILGMIDGNAYGLGSFKLVESSEQGMLTQVERAYRAHSPIVFVAWDPHPMNLRFDIDYLSGGDSTFGPDFGGATVNTLTRAGLTAECPNLGLLLKNLRFSVRGESELMSAMLDRHEQPDVAARTWLQTHATDVEPWLQGVSTADGRAPAALRIAGAAHLAHESLESWMALHKIPLGAAMTALVEGAKVHGSTVFNGVSGVIRTLIEGVSALLALLPAPWVIAATGVLTWLLKRSAGLALFVCAALLYILNQGYWVPTRETLALVSVATLLCAAIGIPLGVAAAHYARVFAALKPVLDLMQTLPSFVYLIPALVLFGLGPVPGLISTMIFALPAPIRLTQAGIASVPVSYGESAQAFGATPLQMLLKVELPSAAPMILAGVTQSIMLSLSMVVIAGLVGAGGLGVPVIRALNSVQVGAGFEAGFVIVLLAIVMDRVCKPRQPPSSVRR